MGYFRSPCASRFSFFIASGKPNPLRTHIAAAGGRIILGRMMAEGWIGLGNMILPAMILPNRAEGREPYGWVCNLAPMVLPRMALHGLVHSCKNGYCSCSHACGARWACGRVRRRREPMSNPFGRIFIGLMPHATAGFSPRTPRSFGFAIATSFTIPCRPPPTNPCRPAGALASQRAATF